MWAACCVAKDMVFALEEFYQLNRCKEGPFYTKVRSNPMVEDYTICQAIGAKNQKSQIVKLLFLDLKQFGKAFIWLVKGISTTKIQDHHDYMDSRAKRR